MPRTKGAKDVKPAKKASILAKKMAQVSTIREIAAQEGVCKDIVRRVTPETVSPEVLEMAERFRSHFATYAEATAMKAVERTFEDVHNLPADKASKVAETQFNIARTIRGESTTKTQSLESKAAEQLSYLLSSIPTLRDAPERAIDAVLEEFPTVDRKLLAEGVKE